jgi:transposase
MSLKFKPQIRVFVFASIIDLRASFDRLTYLVREKMGAKLVDGDLFVFFGKNRRKVKMICYDGTGVVLINKRLERGRFMNVLDLEHHEITVEELDSASWRGCEAADFWSDPVDKIADRQSTEFVEWCRSRKNPTSKFCASTRSMRRGKTRFFAR